MKMDIAWKLMFTLFVLSVCCKSEITISSTNGYIYVKQFYNLSVICQSNKTVTNLSVIRFYYDNEPKGIDLWVWPSSTSCYVNTPYECNVTSNMNILTVPVGTYYNNQSWKCEGNINGEDTGTSKTASVVKITPVTNVNIEPTGDNNVVDVIEGENQTFTCTTGPSRPAAWIQWYIGWRNVTSQAITQRPPQDGLIFNSSSRLQYLGNDKDNNMSIYCEAVNFYAEQSVKSNEIAIYVQVPVKNVTIIQTGINNVVDVTEGENQTFDCITGPSRPAAAIQWYIGKQNVTDQAISKPQQDGDKFISSSRLKYVGKDTDHNKTVYCEAGNIKGKATVNSTTLTIIIKVPVTNVTIEPTGTNHVVEVVEKENQTFTCTTGTSRPAAWIQWYIGGQNVTNETIPQQPLIVGEKFVSSSVLVYTGKDADHKKSLYCESSNIEGRQKYKSSNITFFIKVPVTTVNIIPTGNNYVVDIVEGENQTFTCTTGPSRPAAWILWYVGNRNVTDLAGPTLSQPNADKFISSSKLTYIGNDTDHNKALYCKAENIEATQRSTSENVTIRVKVLVRTVTITPTDNNNVVDVVEGEKQTFNCTTGLSRPAAWIQWYIGEQNVTNQAIPQQPLQDGDKFQSSSSLVYKGSDADHNKFIYCDTANVEGKQRVNSTGKQIYIQVAPKNITLAPEQERYTIREMQHIAGINCTALCRPECTYYWRGPKNYIQNQSNLILGSVYRNESGTYTCYGTNKLGSISSSVVYIDVLYPPFITSLKTNNSNSTVGEGSLTMFQCDIESNPNSDIVWKYNTTGKVLHRDFAVLQSYFTINKTECIHTGIYKCQATNTINGVQEIYSQIIRLDVLCSVRNDVNQSSTPSTIRLRNGDGLNITMHLIAVPPPVISWTFRSNMTGNSSALKSSDVYGEFAHVSNLRKLNMSQADFGVYTLTAYNNIGLEYETSFNVIPQGPPSPPSNISVSCNTVSLKATWKSEFNGGDIQTFRIIWWDIFSNVNKYGHEILDPGEGNYQKYTIANLQPGTLYFLNIEAKNSYGAVISNEHANCTTESRANEESNTAVLGVAVGSACSVVVIVLIVGVSFIMRRHIGKGTDDNGRTHLTTLKTEEEDEDGMKDNVLYQSAGPNFEQQKGASGNEVQKKRSPLNENNVQETALYSEVIGKSNKKTQDDVYSKVKNTKTKVNGKKLKQSEDVYENMDITDNSSPIILPKENRNKDGLQYAELVFYPVPNGSKYVIRGIEDRTIYATVDTTQSIDPLPDSDDEDIGKSSKLDQGENDME